MEIKTVLYYYYEEGDDIFAICLMVFALLFFINEVWNFWADFNNFLSMESKNEEVVKKLNIVFKLIGAIPQP